MRLGVLGPLLVADGAGREFRVTAARQRTLLAALLVRANRVVPVDELAELVWDGAPPSGAVRTVRSYVMRLRQAVGPEAGARIVTREPGYLCRLDEDESDLLRFEALCRRGGAAVRAGAWARADEMLREALGLWRGAPLADIGSQVLRVECVDWLEQTRLQAVEWRIEAELNLGRHDQLVPQLQALVAAHPLHERGHAQLMLALYRCSRAAEALDAFQRARRALVGELGVEPGPELRLLHQRILAADPALAAPEPAADDGPRAAAHGTAAVIPRQLPPTAVHFTGRVRELSSLGGLSQPSGHGAGAAVVAAICGTAGVGKTALALRWAHEVAERFPDGQLYVNLRGYDADEPVSAADALAGFLRALGVPGRNVPPDEPERAAQYRSLLAGRRVLVVLDNAREPAQVRPLLPGTDGCLTLVTSRGALAGLAARDGAACLELDVLPPADALALLRALLGGRVEREPDAAATLVELSCQLPLALRVVAELAAARPDAPLAALAGELTDLRRRLDLLEADDDGATAVRTVLSWSYRHLEPAAARFFRLIGLHPGPDLDAPAAAALAGIPVDQAGQLLTRLARAHLIHTVLIHTVLNHAVLNHTVLNHTVGAGRYGMHDLLRAYARELSDTAEREDGRQAALNGLLDHYLRTAAAAMDTLFPAETSRRPRISGPAEKGGPAAPPPGFADPAAAEAWLDAERANLIAAAAYAADHGRPEHATALSATLDRYLSFGQHVSEAAAIHDHALRAARRAGDRAAEATALTHLGFVAWQQNRFHRAVECQRQALALFQSVGDPAGRARALHRLALVERELGRLRAAVGHAEQVLSLCREQGDRLGQARALHNLGTVKIVQGRLAEAAEHFERVLALLDELGDRRARSVTVKELGVIELRRGRLGPAEERFRQALALCREAGNRDGEAEAVSQLGLVHLSRGRREQAAAHQRRALTAFRELGDRHGESETLARLASAELAAGRGQAALAHLRQALRLARGIATPALETIVLNGLGEALLAAGRPDQAVIRHAAALRLAGQSGDLYEQARAHHGLAVAYHAAGDAERAGGHLQEALTRYTELDAPEAERIRPRPQAGRLS